MTPAASHRNRARRNILLPPFWRRHPLATVGLVIVIALVIVSRLRTPLANDYDRYHNRSFLCVRVVDGDTLDIGAPDGDRDTTRIRLWGVDTPETAKSPGGEMYFGPEASVFARSQVEGERVRLVLSPKKTRGKYGRLLAYIYYDNDPPRMLNEELIIQGYAYADRRFPHLWSERFVQLESKARRQGVGLWSDVTREQMPPWRQRYERWRDNAQTTHAK